MSCLWLQHSCISTQGGFCRGSMALTHTVSLVDISHKFHSIGSCCFTKFWIATLLLSCHFLTPLTLFPTLNSHYGVNCSPRTGMWHSQCARNCCSQACSLLRAHWNYLTHLGNTVGNGRIVLMLSWGENKSHRNRHKRLIIATAAHKTLAKSHAEKLLF